MYKAMNEKLWLINWEDSWPDQEINQWYEVFARKCNETCNSFIPTF